MARALSTALLIGTVAHGISKGFDQAGATDAFYDLTTGNPNIDEEVLGTNMGFRELFLPLPSPLRSFSRMAAIQRGGVTGLLAAGSAGMINNKTLTDHFRDNSQPLVNSQYSSPMPPVDGSLVFALKNSSFA